jgi:uncharacterized membrane protein
MLATLITLLVAFVVSHYAVKLPLSFALWRRLERSVSPLVCVIAGAGLFCVALGSVAILRHRSMNSNALDLGLMDQIVWNSAHGRWLQDSFLTGRSASFLGHHFSPSLALLAPFYWVAPHPEVLLVVQALCIAVSAILLFLVGVRLTHQPWIAASVALMLLAHPLVHDAALFDFHQDVLGMLGIALGLFGLTYTRWEVATCGWLVSILAKEEIALYWSAIGVFVLIMKEGRKLRYLAFTSVNVVWLFLVIRVIIPHFQSTVDAEYSFLTRYAGWGTSPQEVFGTIRDNPWAVLKMLLLPERVGGLGMMLLPVAPFLVRSRPSILILLLPLGINSLSGFVGQHNFRYHYSLLPIVIVVFACLWAAVIIRRKHPTAAGGVLERATVFMLTAAVMFLGGVSPIGVRLPELLRNYLPDAHDRVGYKIMELIPPDASVIAQNKLVPHVSQRQLITLLSRSLAEPADYYLLDVTSPLAPQSADEYVAEVTSLLANTDYGLITIEDGYLVLARGVQHREEDIELAKRMMAQVGLPSAQDPAP